MCINRTPFLLQKWKLLMLKTMWQPDTSIRNGRVQVTSIQYQNAWITDRRRPLKSLPHIYIECLCFPDIFLKMGHPVSLLVHLQSVELRWIRVSGDEWPRVGRVSDFKSISWMDGDHILRPGWLEVFSSSRNDAGHFH